VASFRLTLIKLWFAVFFAMVLAGCKKEAAPPKAEVFTTGRPVVQDLPVNLSVDQTKPGYTIPENFEGLSYETRLLAESPDFLNENNKVLIQLIKNLGPGILRIGGNTSDETDWTGSARTSETPANSLTTTEVDHLAAFSKAIGWPVIFGLNLAAYDPAKAANEANYVYKTVSNLYALQSGNEPDVFYQRWRSPNYNYTNYQREWWSYLSAVRKQTPQATFAGPDITPFNNAWLISFTGNENKNIRLIDGHYYDTGPASLPSIAYTDILTQNSKLAEYLATLHALAYKYHLPYRISEGNSVFGGGKKGVSDVFASALWALDFMWTVAENHGQGINFHGGGDFFAYSPLTVQNGISISKPEYYAMLAFKYGAVGQTILPVTVDGSGYNISAHACINKDKTYTITLINKEVNSGFAFNIQLSHPTSAVNVLRLAAPDMASGQGVTLAGSMVNDDGTFTPSSTEIQQISGNSFVVHVPAGSAAVIMVNDVKAPPFTARR
jgi:hypothetical protein